MTRTAQAIFAASLLLVSVCCALILGSPSDPQRPKGLSAKGISVPDAQLASFAVLRTRPKPPPVELAEKMERVVEGRGFELKVALAQPVSTTVGEEAWVVPGQHYICIMASKPLVAGCNTTAETTKHGMSVVAGQPAPSGNGRRQYTLFGIAPNGVKHAAVRPKGGRAVIVPVYDNVFAYRASVKLNAKVLR